LEEHASTGDGRAIRLHYGTVRVFRRKFTLEDVIDSHACSLQASWRVTNGIPLGRPPFLPVHTVTFVQTLKAHNPQQLAAAPFDAAIHIPESQFWAKVDGEQGKLIPPITPGWDPRPREYINLPWGDQGKISCIEKLGCGAFALRTFLFFRRTPHRCPHQCAMHPCSRMAEHRTITWLAVHTCTRVHACVRFNHIAFPTDMQPFALATLLFVSHL
jgi:hypothetical protein